MKALKAHEKLTLRLARAKEIKDAGIRLHKQGSTWTFQGKKGHYVVTRQEIHRTFAQHGHDGTPTYTYRIALNGALLGLNGTLTAAKLAIVDAET